MFKSKKRVLLIGNEGIVLFGPSGDGIGHEITLAWDVPDFEQQLGETLTEQNRNSPIIVLFDGTDQTYRKEENLPKLSRFDRQRYIRRKLEQAFPSYPVRAAFEIVIPGAKRSAFGAGGSEQQKSYLFVAIPETTQIERVSAVLSEAAVPVVGFGLLPAESAGLVASLSEKLFAAKGRPSRWAVLIGQNETGGLRQVVIKDGTLALTRLTPPPEASSQGSGWVEDMMREFRATLTYISRFGYTAEEGLDVIVICGDAEKRAFEQEKYLPGTNFRSMKTQEAMMLLGMPGGLSITKNNYSDALYVAWMARKGALDAPMPVPLVQRGVSIRRAVYAGATALVLLSLGLFGFTISQYQEYSTIQDDIGQKESQKNLLTQEYEQESKAFEQFPVKPELVRSAISVQKQLEEKTASITPVLNTLKNALDPDVRLSSLSYEHQDLQSQAQPASGARPVPAAATSNTKGTARIIMRFTLLGSPVLEQKVARAEQVAEKLKQAFVGYEVTINSQFGRISRTGRFEGKVGDGGNPAAGSEDMAEIELKGAPL